jgi:curved DNA-binding protein
MEYRDYYATLEVPRTASPADIKKAYRRLARRFHPDVAKADPKAEQRFKEINEANAVLGDPEKRTLYDRLGKDWEAYARAGATGAAGGPAGAGFGGFQGYPGGVRFEYHGDPEDLAGFSDFFRTFFAGGAAGPATSGGASGARVRTGRAASLEDLLGGFAFGGLDEGGLQGGGAAGREPSRKRSTRPPSHEAVAEISLEEAFHGTTRIVEVEGRRLEVRIPRGIDSGRRVRMAAAGPRGADIHVLVRVAPHPVFVRKGHDLHRELPVTLAEALLGAEVPVGTLKGRVLLTVPPGTQPGRTFRLAGQGMPHMTGSEVGDLYVKTRIVLPDDLDDDARALVRRLAALVKQPDPRRAEGAVR